MHELSIFLLNLTKIDICIFANGRRFTTDIIYRQANEKIDKRTDMHGQALVKNAYSSLMGKRISKSRDYQYSARGFNSHCYAVYFGGRYNQSSFGKGITLIHQAAANPFSFGLPTYFFLSTSSLFLTATALREWGNIPWAVGHNRKTKNIRLGGPESYI